MKKLISIVRKTFLLAALTLCGSTALAGNQVQETIKTQGNMALTTRQKALSAIAGLEAKGNTQQLYTVLGQALDEGLTVAEAKEALSQLYAYTGFPRSLNALAQLQKVVSDRKAAGKSVTMGQDDATVLPKNFNSLKEGTEVQTRLVGAPYNYTFAPRTDYYLKAHLFGDIFAGKVLSHADREIVTVSAIASLPGCEPQLRSHCHGALNMGVSREELAAIPDVLEQYVDNAAAARAREAVASVLNEKVPADKAVRHGIEDSPWPVGEPNVNFAKYFDGNSYLAPMGGGASNVTFEPGCRNHWHIHHKGVQVLVCVAGRGWYQEWGKPAVELRPGMVIAIPAEVKHWHGAAKDSWFQHLAYMTNVQEGASNEWCEPVDSATYDALK